MTCPICHKPVTAVHFACQSGAKGGAIGGCSTSPAKAQAARENGKRGGRKPKPMNVLRFVRSEDYVELINLYHLARAALAGQSCTKYDRMIWATKEFAKAHPYCSSTGAYKDLSANLEGY